MEGQGEVSIPSRDVASGDTGSATPGNGPSEESGPIEADLVVAGLGPGDPQLVTRELERLIRAALSGRVALFVRTLQHPTAREIAEQVAECTSFDELYESAGDYEALYDRMAETLVESAAQKPTVFLVPGSPFVGETAAQKAVTAARARGLEVRVVPGVSFVEAALCELGVDCLEEGLQVVDAYQIEKAVLGEGPLLVAQCHSVELLSTVKLALLDEYPPEHRVAVIEGAYSRGAAQSGSAVVWVELVELDRGSVRPGPRTSLFVPPSSRAPGRALRDFVDLVEVLRGPGGCPWDAAQTHHSLSRHLLEETYEVLEAIDGLPPEAPGGELDPQAYGVLEEELGDLLFQIAFHATLAKEAGAFTIADVARGIHEKLVSRHPHVFGTVEVSGPSEVARNWEVIKAEEKQRRSLMDDIGRSLPALLLAHKVQRRAASVGFDWSDPVGVFEKVREELEEVASELGDSGGDGVEWAVAPSKMVDEVGDLLFAVVNLARHLRVDPEEALRKASRRFERRFRRMEEKASDKGLDLAGLSAEELDALWEEAKSEEAC